MPDLTKLCACVLPLAELKASLALLQRGVETFEPRFSARVLRTLTTTRRKLSKEHDGFKVFREALEESYPKGKLRSVWNECRSSREPLMLTIVPPPPSDHATLASLLSLLPTASPSADSMDVDTSAAAADPSPSTSETKPPAKEVTEIVPEQDVYLRLLAGLVLLDGKSLDKVRLLDPLALTVPTLTSSLCFVGH